MSSNWSRDTLHRSSGKLPPLEAYGAPFSFVHVLDAVINCMQADTFPTPHGQLTRFLESEDCPRVLVEPFLLSSAGYLQQPNECDALEVSFSYAIAVL